MAQQHEFALGIGPAIPDADIVLVRGNRKVVSQTLSNSVQAGFSYRYLMKNQLYFTGLITYSSFDFEVSETFSLPNQPAFSCTHPTLNLSLIAGVGKKFKVGNGWIHAEGGISFVKRNARWTDVPSERELPQDLNTVNITIIQYDLFDEPGAYLSGGYAHKLNSKWLLGISTNALFTRIRGDIVDFRDMDTEPNMDRPMSVYAMSLSLSYQL